MRIAVVQHRLRESAEEDARALAASAAQAAAQQAELVVLPEVPTLLGEENPARELFYELIAGLPGQRVISQVARDLHGFGAIGSAPDGADGLGSIALLVGDAAMEPVELMRVATQSPSAAVLMPRSESELQAEAMAELAISLSDSLAGLVLLAECAGAEPGEAGHGGSMIVRLGEVVAEALAEEDAVLVADVALPLAQPEPREALPAIPPILATRLAHHAGRKPAVDYPADLA